MGGRGGSSGMMSSSSNPFPNSLVQETLYHGSVSPNVTTFISGEEGSGAFFFSDDYDYSEFLPGIKAKKGDVPTMYEVKLDIRNPLRVTLTSEQGFGDPRKERTYIQQAKRQGRDSVIFTSNDFGGDPDLQQTFYAVFDNKQIKITKKSKIDFGF